MLFDLHGQSGAANDGFVTDIGDHGRNQSIAALIAQDLGTIFVAVDDGNHRIGGTQIDSYGKATLKGMWLRRFAGFVNLQ
jgi:hypothetical protein